MNLLPACIASFGSLTATGRLAPAAYGALVAAQRLLQTSQTLSRFSAVPSSDAWTVARRPFVTLPPVIKRQRPDSLRALARYASTNTLGAAQLIDRIRSSGPSFEPTEVLHALDLCVKSKVTDKETLSELSKLSQMVLPCLRPQGVQDLTCGFAQLKYFDTGLKDAIADSVLHKLNDYPPASLGKIVRSFSESSYYDLEFLSQVVKHCREHQDKLDAASISDVLYAVGLSGFRDETVGDLALQLVVHLQQQFGSKALADVIFGAAHMGWADNRLQSLVADYAIDNMSDLDAESLSKLLYGLSQVGYADSDVYESAASRTLELLDTLEPEHINRMMVVLSRQMYHHPELLSALSRKVAANVNQYSASQLRGIVSAFNLLGYTSTSVAQAGQRLDELLTEG